MQIAFWIMNSITLKTVINLNLVIEYSMQLILNSTYICRIRN